MTRSVPLTLPPRSGRVEWIDVAKGFCIVFVVMMHSTLGVEAAAGREGFMGAVVAFARPFRMPDFFLIAGLFLARVIDRDWRRYVDRKVIHFAYFYALWVTIQFAFKAPAFTQEWGAMGVIEHYLLAYVQPFGTLWFIYILPIFFVITKLLRNVPVWLVLGSAAALEIAPVDTGALLVDEFAARYVYFFAGYALAPTIFRLAETARAHGGAALFGLLAWGLVNGWAVAAGVAHWPLISLILGFLGAAAVVAVSALLAATPLAAPLRHVGARSLVVYLAFFLPMAVTRTVLLKTGIVDDVGVISALVTLAAVVGPLVLAWVIERFGLFRFLIERPGWARLDAARHRRLVPAE